MKVTDVVERNVGDSEAAVVAANVAVASLEGWRMAAAEASLEEDVVAIEEVVLEVGSSEDEQENHPYHPSCYLDHDLVRGHLAMVLRDLKVHYQELKVRDSSWARSLGPSNLTLGAVQGYGSGDLHFAEIAGSTSLWAMSSEHLIVLEAYCSCCVVAGTAAYVDRRVDQAFADRSWADFDSSTNFD